MGQVCVWFADTAAITPVGRMLDTVLISDSVKRERDVFIFQRGAQMKTG